MTKRRRAMNKEISTHAPRVRRDGEPVQRAFTAGNFYSRASCEARPLRGTTARNLCNFYSRASCEARPTLERFSLSCYNFYSRASCEARPCSVVGWAEQEDFYSRASCEARHRIQLNHIKDYNFYSRASCEARRIMGITGIAPVRISTHAPRVRRDGMLKYIANCVIFLLTRLV